MFDRDEQEISQIIENGLEAILSGRATLESVVAQHPEQAEVIRPELEGALWLVSQRQEVEARPGFVTASRKRVVDRIKAEARSQGARHSLFGFIWPTRQHAFQWMATVVVLMVLFTGMGSLLTVSQTSLPGDGLYAVKRISETVSYSVTLSEVRRVELSAEYAERRLEEARVLISKGDYGTAEVSLQDYEQGVTQTLVLLEEVETKDEEPVAVEQLAVSVKAGLVTNSERLAEIVEQVPPQAEVRMTVRVQKALNVSRNGVLAAHRVYQKAQGKKSGPAAAPPVPPTATRPVIRPTSTPRVPTSVPTEPPRPRDTDVPPTVAPTQPPKDTPAPKPSATPNPTSTSTPAPTDTAQPTSTPTAEPTAVPTSTPLPIPTDTPVPPPTEAPTDVPTQVPTDVPVAPTVAPTSDQSNTDQPAGVDPTQKPTKEPKGPKDPKDPKDAVEIPALPFVPMNAWLEEEISLDIFPVLPYAVPGGSTIMQ